MSTIERDAAIAAIWCEHVADVHDAVCDCVHETRLAIAALPSAEPSPADAAARALAEAAVMQQELNALFNAAIGDMLAPQPPAEWYDEHREQVELWCEWGRTCTYTYRALGGGS